jgi:hypothetical protein
MPEWRLWNQDQEDHRLLPHNLPRGRVAVLLGLSGGIRADSQGCMSHAPANLSLTILGACLGIDEGRKPDVSAVQGVGVCSAREAEKSDTEDMG